jgi:tetratricopeptide (TPR) repeat protein
MPPSSCIICHMKINDNQEVDSCPNDHQVHKECLQEWLVHSSNCPLCNEKYSKEVMDKYKGFLQKKKEKEEKELEEQIKKETIEKIKEVNEKILFKKFISSIEKMANEGNFEHALEILEAFPNKNLTSYKGQHITFLLGKTNYLRERYDLAINHLFKLVKEKYDYPDAFLYLGKAYEELGLEEKAQWAYERVKK